MSILKSIDPTILYIIGVSILAVLFTFLGKVLKDKKMVSESDLNFAVTLLNLSMNIVDELHLNKEAEIKKIAGIVSQALLYVKTTLQDKTQEEQIELANDFALDLCGKLEIEVTPEREAIIKQLITFGLGINVK